MKKPNFFIIGAPKCGTTSLSNWLAGHPQIFFSKIKEPSFFDTDRKFVGRFTLKEYENLFSEAGPEHLAVGEGSTQYIFSRVAIQNIESYTENARFIVCLRDPVEMAISFHGQLLRMGIENVKDFERAWHLQEEREKGRCIPLLARNVGFRNLLYKQKCLLGEQVQRLFSTVERDRVLIILLEEMKADARGVYKRVLSFLGVPDDGREDFPIENPARKLPGAFAKLLQTATQIKRFLRVRRRFGFLQPFEQRLLAPGGKSEISDQFRSELASEFYADVRLLEKLIKRDLSHWQPIQLHMTRR